MSPAPVSRPGTLVVAEIFGPTVQGEGASLGRRVGFVRLGRCNLDCGRGAGSTWHCDTPHTWDWDRYDPARELRAVPVDEVVARVEAMAVDRVVVTGGEPMLQQRRLLAFLAAARERGWDVELETNGTLSPLAEVAALVSRFTVSPKLSGSGVPAHLALRPRALKALRGSGKAVFKFVAAQVDDLAEIADVVATHDLSPVTVMPAGTSAEEVLERGRLLADPVIARGWDLTTRLHILLWGDVRGR